MAKRMFQTTKGKKTEKEKNRIVIKLSQKTRITTEEEMKNHLHTRLKGSSITKDKTKYNRKQKHKEKDF